MEPKKYVRLTYSERVKIASYLKLNMSQIAIAKALQRNRSTISREISNWVRIPTDQYDADIADFGARYNYLNKRNLDKISSHNALKIYVYRGLLSKQSPEQIAGRIRIIYPNDPLMRISYEAIYIHIYGQDRVKLRRKLISLLLHSNLKRRSRKGIKINRTRIKEAKSIDNRPSHILLREEPGHFEGDLVIGPKQASAIGTIVERKTRFVYIVKLENRKSETVTKAFKRSLSKLNSNLKKTMTYDNGMEMANHKWFTDKTGIAVYFAHPYSSWERGTNENTNGLVRRYFPKHTDFNKVTEAELKEVQDKLNKRPRKVLGFYTPNEMMNIEILKCEQGYSENFLSPQGSEKIVGNNLS